MLFGEFWDGLSGILFVIFVMGGWVITGVVSSISTAWRKVRESEHMAALKQTMVDKGMSAEEIERVILIDKPAEEKAASEAEADRSAVQFAVELSAQDMSPTDLERILETYKAADGKTRRMMAKLADEMFSNGANGAKVVAAVRALCQPAAKGVATEHGGSPYLNVNIH